MKLGPRRNAIIKRDGWLEDTMLTQPPVPYDFCVCIPISRLLTVGSTPVQHSVLNVKAVVALVGAFSVIVQLHRLIDLRHYSTLTHSSCTRMHHTLYKGERELEMLITPALVVHSRKMPLTRLDYDSTIH